ncbi:hypothetical protein GW17_00028210 [Ensete ventricosum]|nr:hypothetical protein GW17_00028210 [Ensete ventricosum]
MRSSVLFWYLRISLSATVPGRNRCRRLVPFGLDSYFCATYEPKHGERRKSNNRDRDHQRALGERERERERDHGSKQYARGLAAGGVAQQIASSSDGDG